MDALIDAIPFDARKALSGNLRDLLSMGKDIRPLIKARRSDEWVD
jgi:hypothetical protein